MFKVFKTSGIEGNYSISANPLFVTNNCWTVYPAKHKTTNKKCSVWQFDKKECEARLTKTGLIYKTNKNIVLEDVYDALKKYIANLAKFRHPNILTIIEPLEDHKSRILFVTEYVVNDLKSVDKDNIREIMVSKGLLQIASGLKFLHQSVNCVHLNINPNTIYITENFDWKICGFQFIENLENGIRDHYVNTTDSRMPAFTNLDFKYTSPNLIMNHKLDYINDLFSLGCLIYYLFNKGKHLINCSEEKITEYERSYNQVLKVANAPNVRTHALFSSIPPNYFEMFLRLIKETESNTDVIQLRTPLTIDDVINSSIFNNELIKVLNVIDEFPTLSNAEKINFLKNLRPLLKEFPDVLIINKFMPILIAIIQPFLDRHASKSKRKRKDLEKLDMEEEQLVTLTADNLLGLSNQVSILTFSDQIYPLFLNVLQTLDIMSFKLALVSNLSTIESRLGANASDITSKQSIRFSTLLMTIFEQSIVPANNNPSLIVLQENILNNLSAFIDYQNYSTITHKIFEALSALYSSTTSLKIKNLTIKSFILMINNTSNQDKNLNNYIIIEKLLPLIQNTSISNFKNPMLLMNLIDLYKCIFAKLSSSTKDSITISSKNEHNIFDIVLELIFFELWKMTRHITTEKDLNSTFKTLDQIDRYLKQKSTENVKIREKSGINDIVNEDNLSSKISPMNTGAGMNNTVSPVQAADAVSSNNGDDDDEFGDFTTSPRQTTPISLRPSPGAHRSLGFGQTAPTTIKPVTHSHSQPSQNGNTFTSARRVDYPVMSMANTVNSSTQPATQYTPNAATSNSNYMSAMSAMPVMRATTPQSPVQSASQQSTNSSNSGAIDWSNASKTVERMTAPMSQLSMQQEQKQPVNNNNMFSVIQPTKKYNSGLSGSTAAVSTNSTGSNTPTQNDFFDSLI